MTRVVVVGAAKSGTSALFAAIRSSENWVAIYETGNQGQIEFLTSHPAPRCVTKVLLRRVVARNLDLAGFDRSVYLVRDPRDVLISWMLFRPLLAGSASSPAFVAEFLATLRRKEADPPSVSLHDIEAVYRRHGVGAPFVERFHRAFADELAVRARYPDMYRLRYEDFRAGEIDAVSRYLGVPLRTDVRVGEHIAHNERAKSSGGWRHWFTSSDIETYRPVFEEQLTRHGYDLDWTLASSPHIDPRTASGYLERNLGRPRLVGAGRAESLSRYRYTEERLSVLASGIADGREAAMIELAFVHLRGLAGPPDFDAARELLDDAIARGNGYAMIHRGFAAQNRLPGFGRGAAAHFASARNVLGERRAERLVEELDAAWREHVLPFLARSPGPRIRSLLGAG